LANHEASVSVAKDGPGRLAVALRSLLAAAWCEVLELPAIDIRADFFELGGYSMLASRLTANIEELLGIEVSVRALFEHPTVAQLAEFIEREASPVQRHEIGALLATLEAGEP
jgi:acyl carrier protein